METSNTNEKLNLIRQILEYVLNHPYAPEPFAEYVYMKSLDEKSYRYEDQELNRLLDTLRGMSAGEEFYYSKSLFKVSVARH